ncbi:hypothetical protein Acsp04_12370 [Actinomadura sp. NBRC 104425]|uniref:hypothetical protein n=1 Tax=Actinomadura sp. NBRC 104425 TaxID=3032204 RepID=UPI0024A2230F|nr:hypothetical protein [Actinomadura sp. NBRC 104425]GLZ11002.1 hypothetical protein Acsp04_12370 [Actinomadura sp. NBRC 104425]
MPSRRHDALNELFRENPRLVVDILGHLKDLDLPPDLPVQEAKNTYNDRPSIDFTADNVFTVGPPQDPVHGIIVEIQQTKSQSKRRQLPRYAAAQWLSQRHGGVDVIVVCPNADTAAFYAEPIRTELPGYTLQPVVVGPEQIPMITDPTEAAARLGMAVLSVSAHGEKHRKVVEALMAALDGDTPQYYEHAYNIAGPAARKIMEEIMQSTKWPVYTPLAREHYGKGREEGRAEGLEEGRAEGRKEGRTEEAANATLMILSSRGVNIPDDARERITNCTDLDQLHAWLTRAANADTIDDVFA